MSLVDRMSPEQKRVNIYHVNNNSALPLVTLQMRSTNSLGPTVCNSGKERRMSITRLTKLHLPPGPSRATTVPVKPLSRGPMTTLFRMRRDRDADGVQREETWGGVSPHHPASYKCCVHPLRVRGTDVLVFTATERMIP